MKVKNLCVAFVALVFYASAMCAQQPPPNIQRVDLRFSSADGQTGPALLTYDELIQLYQQDIPPAPLRDKLNRLLNTPFVSNRAWVAGVRPMKPSAPQTGRFLRVAEWNIERGLEFDAVRLAFTDAQQSQP